MQGITRKKAQFAVASVDAGFFARTANQIFYGTGTGFSSEAAFTWNPTTNVLSVVGSSKFDNGSTTDDIVVFNDNAITAWSIPDGGNLVAAEGKNIVFGTATGTKIGTATTQRIGFWNTTPIVQPTTGIAAATFAANTSAIANDSATFDGYTIGQMAKALRNVGILA